MTKPTDGFVRLPNWLVDDSSLTLHELSVYIVLLRFRDPKTGKCFPGLTTIADRARVSRKTAERTVKLLEARKMIRVQRRSSIRENKPNVYEVSLPAETPDFLWADSARNQRIPKRSKGTDSESPGTEVDAQPTDSESVPTDSESLPPQTPSLPNKIQVEQIQEQASTRTLAHASERFTFTTEDNKATEKQVAYLRDLAIQLSYGSTGGVPDDIQLQRWRKLTRPEATAQIRGYLNALGRPDEIQYPEWGTPEYNALSQAGRDFADTAGMPDSVFEYGFRLKENTA